MSNKRGGGCLCGAVRYEISGEPMGVFHCHCSVCRRTGASAFVTWFCVASSEGKIIQGKMKIFESSRDGRRNFCPTCGAQISFFFESDPDHIYFTVATLDAPEELTPTSHCFIGEAVRWLHVDDNLPEFTGNPPEIEQLVR